MERTGRSTAKNNSFFFPASGFALESQKFISNFMLEFKMVILFDDLLKILKRKITKAKYNTRKKFLWSFKALSARFASNLKFM